jgi:hypothetical protein
MGFLNAHEWKEGAKTLLNPRVEAVSDADVGML